MRCCPYKGAVLVVVTDEEPSPLVSRRARRHVPSCSSSFCKDSSRSKQGTVFFFVLVYGQKPPQLNLLKIHQLAKEEDLIKRPHGSKSQLSPYITLFPTPCLSRFPALRSLAR